MASLLDRCRALLGRFASGPATYPTALLVPPDRVLDSGSTPTLARDTQYFAIRLNQMRLSSGRRWWVDVDPMAFVVSEFLYDGQPTAVPFVIGPSLIEQYGQKIPDGMVFDDTVVAGLHPYRGGRLSMTVILYELPRTDNARRLLNLVEGAAGVFPSATQLAPYLKTASVLLDGVESVLGLDGVQPVAGRRHEIAPDLGDDLGSGYFALVDRDVSADSVWVRERRLMQQASGGADLLELTGADCLLYSVVSVAERSDLDQLGYQAIVREAEKLAASDSSDEGWKRAKAIMTTAFTQIIDSPDLTTSQGDSIRAGLRDRFKALHDEALATANLGFAAGDADRAAKLHDAVSLLDL